MKSVDSELTRKERKILTYLLSEYKLQNRFPGLNEIKRTLKLDYDEQIEEKMVKQFVKRGFPQVGMTRNQEKVFDYIIEQYSKFDRILDVNDIERELNLSAEELIQILAKLERIGVIHREKNNEEKIIPRISKIGYDHKTILKDGRILKPIEAACVIDALGLPFTYNQDASIFSKDPISKQEIKIIIKDEKIIFQQPDNLLVYLGSQCSTTVFFTSEENLKEWEKQHPDQKGTIVNMKQAIILARKLFENRLEIDYVRSCEISIDQDQKNIEWLDLPSDDKDDKCCD
ncbi:MAG: organomercurial lyase [Candidatus Lokiarchaeia archaeon]